MYCNTEKKIKNEQYLPYLESQEPFKVFTIDLSSKALVAVPEEINTYRNCKSLNLACNKLRILKETSFQGCLHLRELKLYGNNIKQLKGLHKLQKLEDLQVQFNEILAIGSSLKYSKALKVLRIDNNKLTSLQVNEVCSLNNLTYLDISSNSLQTISGLSVLSSLEELHCTHNALASVDGLHSLKNLCYVDVSYNNVSCLGGLKNLPKLTVLNVEHNKLTSLSTLGQQNCLQDLKLCSNEITNLKHLCEQCPQLEVLHMSNNKINSTSQVQHLLHLGSLLELQIYGNPVVATPQGKLEVLEILRPLELEYFDKINIKKASPQNRSHLMRPMSANQMVSSRLIEDQIRHSATSLQEFTDKLNCQFAEMHEVLYCLASKGTPSQPELTSTSKKVTCSIASGSGQSVAKHDGGVFSQVSVKLDRRPVSRCSSRAKLEEAMAFAAEIKEAPCS